MPILTPQQAILIGIVVAPVVFALCAYITRANLRRTVAGLTGVIAYCLVQYAWDLVAASLGWWSYPAYGTHGNPPMPIWGYFLSGLVYAGFAFFGWRSARRFGWKGLLGFLLAWSLWGFLLDTNGTALFSSSRLMVIAPGAAPRIADFLVYATCMSAVLLAIRMVGGPYQADSLARTPKHVPVRGTHA